MARQVNSNYQMFKRNLQRRFVDRYKHNESIQYTEQDREHLKLIKPEIPEPIINNRIEKRFGKRIGRGGGAKKPVFNNVAFEREYLEFLNMLKATKAKAEQAPAEVQEELIPDAEPEQVQEPVEETVPEETETV